ncbi:MAG TPA: hypothetical protein VJU61_02710 [Polyangiaceae bacterium]|nr:hypothetical protein [Polyangiaceae bacterium]
MDELDRRETTLNMLQLSVAARAQALPAPQPVEPSPSVAVARNPAARDPEEEPMETPESIVAFDDAQRLVDEAIESQATWDDARRQALRTKMRGLSRSQLDSVMGGLAVAINSGKLTTTAFPPM